MSKPPVVEPVPALRPRTNLNAVVGVVFSAIGLVGWIVTLAILFSFQYDQNASDDGQRELIRGLGNSFTYLARVVTGLFGLIVFGFFSAVGMIVSALGLDHERRKLTLTGLGLGIAGVVIGCGLILWRMVAWGVFS